LNLQNAEDRANVSAQIRYLNSVVMPDEQSSDSSGDDDDDDEEDEENPSGDDSAGVGESDA
jgi:hypothetical protein